MSWCKDNVLAQTCSKILVVLAEELYFISSDGILHKILQSRIILRSRKQTNYFTEHFVKYFSSVVNDIGDTRLLGMSEEQLYYHESVQTITQSCNHQPPGDPLKFKFYALEPKEVASGGIV